MTEPNAPDLPTAPGGFRCILADPPWHHASRSPKGQTSRSPSHHYATMSTEEIAALPIASIAARDCHLFLWTTGPHLEQAFRVMRSWGFRYSSLAFVWVKRRKSECDDNMLFMDARDLFTGMGYTTRQNAELILLGRRGSPARLSKAVHQVIASPRREHSRKPTEAVSRIETYCAGPRLELFAREERPGWLAWGLETRKFNPGVLDAEAAA